MTINGKLSRTVCSPVGLGASAGVFVLALLACGLGYIAFPDQAVRAQATAPDARVTITLSNFKFDPKDVSVPLGGTVEWIDDTGRHLVEADDGSFHSPILTAGSKFEHRFDKPGTYLYHCSFHGAAGGKEMAGTVTVIGSK
jgi:plastocyanin